MQTLRNKLDYLPTFPVFYFRYITFSHRKQSREFLEDTQSISAVTNYMHMHSVEFMCNQRSNSILLKTFEVFVNHNTTR